LGEAFALQTHINLHRLSLKIRRVKSNLDDVEAFSKSVPYIPAKISFEAASADLLKLLVAPLYGSSHGMGIRELLQNSIDAVREFEDLATLHPEIAGTERYSQGAEIVLEINTNEKSEPTEVIVTDRGVGMTPEVVQQYFLRAGASFRKSDSWRQDHEDSSGHSRVLRTGRFGVGALAAFLLGEEIEVTTRHDQASSADGIRFNARLDDESISLARTIAPAGTRIRIKVPERLRDGVRHLLPHGWEKELSFGSSVGHYFLERPSIQRIFGGKISKLQPVAWLPSPEDGNSAHWRCFSTKEFEKVFWTYKDNYPSLSSNGIVISAGYTNLSLSSNLRAPTISVFDKDGYLPVNLQRTGLQTDELPFKSELTKSATTDLVAHAVLDGPSTGESLWFDGAYPGFRRWGYDHQSQHWAHWLITQDGFLLNDRRLIERFSPEYMFIGIGGAPGYVGWGDRLRNLLPNKTLCASYLPNSLGDLNVRIKGLFQSVMTGRTRLWWVDYAPVLASIPAALVEKIRNMKPGRGVLREIEFIDRQSSKKGWHCFHFKLPDDVLVPSDLKESAIKNIREITIDPKNPIMFIMIKPIKWKTENYDDTISAQWLQDWRRPLVPFDVRERHRLEQDASALATEFIRIRRDQVKKSRKSK
jgi:molecular chaperone HtpG